MFFFEVKNPKNLAFLRRYSKSKKGGVQLWGMFFSQRKIIAMYSFCFLSVPVNSSQLQLNLNPNQNEINSPYVPFYH